MDFVSAAKIIKKFIEKTINSEKKPGISYIVSKVLSFPALKPTLIKLFTPKEILEICYMSFFMFEGYDEKIAEWKTKNQLFLLDLTEIGDIDYIEVKCGECEGDRYIQCSDCNGEGEVECGTCGGYGEVDDKECDNCNGSGYESCHYCDGEGEVECSECSGDGTVQSDEPYVLLNKEFWITSDIDLAEELQRNIYNDNFIKNMYDMLDQNSAGLFLVKTIGEYKKISIDEFKSDYGIDPTENEGEYKVESVIPLKDSSYKFQITSGTSPTIR